MIYFVRHGQTDFNAQYRIQGQLEVPLNEVGISQAIEIGEMLKEVKFDKIYCSPLARTKQTAEIINEYHNIPIVYDDRLKEYYAGSRQGDDFREWEALEQPDLWDEETQREYGAETFEEFQKRVVSFYRELEGTKERVLIVSHGGVYRHIYRYLHNIKEKVKVQTLGNCEIVVFEK